MAITDFFRRKQGIRIPEDELLPEPVPSSSAPWNTNLSNWNPFTNFSAVRLPLTEEVDENVTDEPGLLKLSKWDRLIVFSIFLLGSITCYVICIFMFPILSLKPRKFILLWTLGSVFFIVSFAFVQGIQSYIFHLFSGPRIAFTTVFFASIGLTVYSSMVLKSTLLSLIFAVIQLIAQLYYTISYFPFGKTTLGFTSRVALNQAETWINS